MKLGISGFLCFLIPYIPILTWYLHQAAFGDPHEPLLTPIIKPFQELKQALSHATALHLPSLTLPFSLYVTVKEGYVFEFLGHKLGSFFALIESLAKNKNKPFHPWMSTHHICLSNSWTSHSWIKKQNLTFGSPITHHYLHLPQPGLSLNL